MTITDTPIRQRCPVPPVRPVTSIERVCEVCGSSFLGLAPGATGERGLWRDWRWYCSAEAFPSELGVPS